ncbi:MAG: RagB/SusD family nutrient uptake outer membrane protein [Bacteroidota bacterium]
MKFTNIKYIAILAVLALLGSCADLNELSPNTSVLSGDAVTGRASAKAALNGVYDAVDENPFDRWLSLAQYFSDEADATGTFPTRLEFGNLNVFPANGTMAGAFTGMYVIINRANNVIDAIPGVKDDAFTAEERNAIVAEAKFLRAHAYLHLVTLWGEVPLVLTPTLDVGEVLNVPRSSVADIYTQIIADFTEASNNLDDSGAPNRATGSAARGFLARVALYQERWSEAQSLATQVLGDGFDLTAVPFLDDQLYSIGYTTADGNTLNFFYGPSDFGGRYSIGPSTAIIAAFEPGDARFAESIDTATAAVPYGLKYPSFSAGISGTASDPIFVMRHAEMVLIAAEAAAEQGNFGIASDFFNQVRSRAGLEAIELTTDNFVDAILKERFTEFAFEGPFRLIDLRRKGKAQEVLGPIGYDACDNVWPLPRRDIDRNQNLQQNDCCNC